MHNRLMTQAELSAEEIKTARLSLGESQEVFGRRFGVDQSTAHRWETEPPRRGPARLALRKFLNELAAKSEAAE